MDVVQTIPIPFATVNQANLIAWHRLGFNKERSEHNLILNGQKLVAIGNVNYEAGYVEGGDANNGFKTQYTVNPTEFTYIVGFRVPDIFDANAQQTVLSTYFGKSTLTPGQTNNGVTLRFNGNGGLVLAVKAREPGSMGAGNTYTLTLSGSNDQMTPGNIAYVAIRYDGANVLLNDIERNIQKLTLLPHPLDVNERGLHLMVNPNYQALYDGEIMLTQFMAANSYIYTEELVNIVNQAKVLDAYYEIN